MKRIRPWMLCLLPLLTAAVGYGQTIYVKNITLTTRPMGSKEYVARDEIVIKPDFYFHAGESNAYPDPPNNFFTARIDNSLVLNTDYLSSSQLVDPDDRTLNINLAVGSTGGGLDVGGTGGAGYQLPIFTPPGTNGMQPSLGLSYNSQGSNGIAGWGWNITGMSAISRVGKDLFHDGAVEQFRNELADKLSLDGNRLVLVSGTGGSAVFGTEVGNTLQIQVTGATTEGYTGFTVRTKDGKTIEFGTSSDSRVSVNYEHSGQSKTCVTSWLIKKIRDENDNYIVFNYGSDFSSGGSEVWLNSVEYTGNDAAGMTPYASVEFTYTKRSDVNRRYIAIGGAVIGSNSSSIPDGYTDETLLLREIRVKYEGNIVRRYELRHHNRPSSWTIGSESHTTTEYSFLSEITEYGQNNESYNSTLFSYYEKEHFDNAVRYSEVSKNFTSLMEDSQSRVEYIMGDFTGDGIQDRMVVEQDYDAGQGLDKARWFLQIGSYYECDDEDDPNCGTVIFANPGGNSLMFTTKDYRHMGWGLPLDKVVVADFNNDGRDDLIIPYWDGIDYDGGYHDRYDKLRFLVYRSDCSTSTSNSFYLASDFYIENWFPLSCNGDVDNYFDENSVQIQVGDFDGDRYLDAVVTYVAEAWEGGMYWSREPEQDRRVVDFIDITNSNGYFYYHPPITREKLCFGRSYTQVMAVPLDIDLKADLLVIDNGTTYAYEMDQNGNFSGRNLNMNFKDWWRYKFGDLNGDGLVDIVYQKWDGNLNEDDLFFRYNTGSNFSSEHNLTALVPFDLNEVIRFTVGDYNGDGKSDIWVHNSYGLNGAFKYFIYFSTGYNGFDFQKFERTSQQFVRPYISDGQNIDSHSYQQKYVDFNGDGKIDFYNTYLNNDDMYIVNFYPHKKHLYLEKFADGLGNRTRISYDNIAKGGSVYSSSAVSKLPLHDLRAGLTVVSQLDRLPYKSDIALSTVKYSYKDAITHRDKGFLGFQELKTSTALSPDQYKESKTEFKLDEDKYVLNAKKVSGYIYNRPNSSSPYVQTLLSTTSYDNQRRDLNSNTRYFHYQSRVTQEDALTGIRRTTVQNVDDWGNLTLVTTKHGDTLSPRATMSTVTTYTNAGRWCNARPDYITTSRTHADEPDITFSWNEDYVYFGSSKNFHLEKTINHHGQPKAVTNSYDYNVFGNVVSVTKSQTEDGNLPNRSSMTVFDSRGRFALEQSTELGYTVRKTYHGVYGAVLTVKDVQGLMTSYEYDNFGREKKATNPANMSVTTGISFNANTTQHATSLYYTQVQNPAGADQKIWYNSLGRDIRTEMESFNGQTVVIEKEYFNDGRVKKQKYPHFGGGDSRESVHEYDSYLRPWKVTSNGLVSEITYSGKTTTSKDPAGKETSRTVDDGGNLVESKETISSASSNTVSYLYYASGSLKSLTTTGLNTAAAYTVSYEYDIYGNKTKSTDPDAGIYTYEYNAFGEARKQTDPKGNWEEFVYDALGRLVRSETHSGAGLQYKVENSYVAAGNNNGSGKISSVSLYEDGSTSPSHKVDYSYDAFGRGVRKDEFIGTDQFTKRMSYNWLGQITSEEYPSGVKAEYEYNSAGQMTKVKRIDGGLNKVIWEVGQIDAFGKARQVSMADGAITSNFGYDSYEMPETIITTANDGNGTVTIQDLEFDFNAAKGVLNTRWDHKNNNQNESFTYDALYRLSTYAVNGGTQTTMNYYKDGSIENKSDVGSYRYTDENGNIQNPPHGVKRIGTDNGTYRQISQELIYNELNRVEEVKENINRMVFAYGSGRQRIKSSFYQGAALRYHKYFLDAYEKVVQANGDYKEITYIRSSGGIVAAVVEEKLGANPATEQTLFIHTDYLGSIQSLSREKSGQSGVIELVAEFAYDPWGRLRRENDWTQYYTSENAHPAFRILGRGFTGHEHIVEFRLINMNARLYDPVLARFFSPDNYLQAPDYAQNFNRFSYCWNNPLSYTDPSGDFIFTILSAIFCPALLPLAIQADIGWISGGISSDAQGGSFFDGAIAGGAIGALNGAISMVLPSINIPLGGGFGLNIGPQISFGTDGLGIGANATLGYDIGSGFNAGVNVGATYYSSAVGTGAGGFEGRAGYGLGYKGEAWEIGYQLGIGSTYFFGGGTSQQTGHLYLGGRDWKLTYENDTWAPVPGLANPKTANERRDKYRTAAMRLDITGGNLKGTNAGFNLFTGEPNRGDDGAQPTSTFLGPDANRFRFGAVYVGYKNARVGLNSERYVRGPIQNGFHDIFDYPHFQVLDIPSRFYFGQYSSNPYTLW